MGGGNCVTHHNQCCFLCARLQRQWNPHCPKYRATRRFGYGFTAQLVKLEEYQSISIDATYKLAVKVAGHTRSQSHNYVSVVGMRGAPLALVPMCGEASPTLKAAVEYAVPPGGRSQVVHVASDVCSPSLFRELRTVLPNLASCSLDPMPLCFTVDSRTKHQRVRPTVVGLVMRPIMGKFCIPDPLANPDPYVGHTLPKHTEVENR